MKKERTPNEEKAFNSFNIHRLSIHEDKTTFKCWLCKKEFKTEGFFRNHVESKHSDEFTEHVKVLDLEGVYARLEIYHHRLFETVPEAVKSAEECLRSWFDFDPTSSYGTENFFQWNAKAAMEKNFELKELRSLNAFMEKVETFDSLRDRIDSRIEVIKHDLVNHFPDSSNPLEMAEAKALADMVRGNGMNVYTRLTMLLDVIVSCLDEIEELEVEEESKELEGDPVECERCERLIDPQDAWENDHSVYCLKCYEYLEETGCLA